MRRGLITGLALSASFALAACGSATTATTAPPASVAASAPASAAASPPASQAPAASDTITIQNFAFAPAALTVRSGATVTWTNQDGPSHSVKWGDGTAGSATLATGATYTRTFATPGTYPYVCGIHASMKGTIVVK